MTTREPGDAGGPEEAPEPQHAATGSEAADLAEAAEEQAGEEAPEPLHAEHQGSQGQRTAHRQTLDRDAQRPRGPPHLTGSAQRIHHEHANPETEERQVQKGQALHLDAGGRDHRRRSEDVQHGRCHRVKDEHQDPGDHEQQHELHGGVASGQGALPERPGGLT